MIGMTEAEVFDRINGWGIARDGELRDLTDNLVQTQSVVTATFEQARSALMSIVVDFRAEAETMRQNSYAEASQGLARLELVVTEARARFDAQEARFARDLNELGRRQQTVETFVQAAPAPTGTPPPTPPRVATSPGGTVHTFYPGGPADGVLQPPAPAASGLNTPPQHPGQQPDAWAAWPAAARRSSTHGPAQPALRSSSRLSNSPENHATPSPA